MLYIIAQLSCNCLFELWAIPLLGQWKDPRNDSYTSCPGHSGHSRLGCGALFGRLLSVITKRKPSSHRYRSPSFLACLLERVLLYRPLIRRLPVRAFACPADMATSSRTRAGRRLSECCLASLLTYLLLTSSPFPSFPCTQLQLQNQSSNIPYVGAIRIQSKRIRRAKRSS